MKKLLWILIIFSSCNQQKPNKDYIFDRVVYEVENNYAGFKIKAENNLEYYNNLKIQTYDALNDREEKSKKEIINNYLSFFNDKHLYVSGRRNDYRPREISFKSIDSSTNYLRIETFNQKLKLDNLLDSVNHIILSKPNLIIDLKGNKGGSDNAFSKLLPMIATNNIYGKNIEFLASPDNCKQLEKDFNKNVWSVINNGKFIYPPWLRPSDGSEEFILKYDYQNNRFENPEQIAVIIDSNVASSAEQFVLYSKQSKKVKVFGENTSGCLDFSNCRKIDLYEDYMKLSVPMTRIKGYPKHSIDHDGIAPDYYLPNENQIDQIQEYFKL